VDAVAPELTTIRERVALVGSLQAKRRVEVAPKFAGRLTDIGVDRGDAVRLGQVIARLEDDELRQQVRRAEAQLELSQASLAQREAELNNVRAEFDRNRNLQRDGVISSQMLDQAETSVQVSIAQANVARASVSQSEAELAELRIRLGQTEILSPLNGVVAQRYVDPGALVTTATPVALILELSPMVIVVNVPEREFNKVQNGSQARVLVDAFAGEEFTGQVVRISPLLDPQTRTAPVEIELENPGGRLKAEMFARVDLNLMTEREAVLVPRDALVYRNNRAGVFVIEADVAVFRPVQPGVSEGDQIEIVSGVSQAEIVVTRGANLLKSGDAVRVGPTERETTS
jgi:RND family efflux transporter MFP subunit